MKIYEDERVTYLVIIILMASITIYPLGLPVSVSALTKEAYAYIENLPEGSYVVTDFAVTSVVRSPMAIALMNHLVKNNLKIVMLGTHSAGAAVMTAELVIPEVRWSNYKYGEDWIYLGFLPGYEAALTVFARDTWRAYEKDYYGNLIEDYPIIKNMPPMEKMTGVVLTPGVPVLYIRQWAEPYGVALVVCVEGEMAGAMPYVQAGYLKGLVSGLTGAGEYEVLSGIPGKAIARADGLSVLHLTLVIGVVLANIIYFSKKYVFKGGV